MSVVQHSLTKLSLIYTLGSLFSKAITFLLFFMITFYLSKDELGYYDLVLTTTSLIIPFVTLQLNEAIVRWYIEDSSDDIKKKVFTNLINIVSLTSIFFALIYILIYIIYPFVFPSAIILIIFFQSIFSLIQPILRGVGDNVSFTLSGIVYSLLNLSFTFIFLFCYESKIEGLLLANAISLGLSIVFFFIRNKLYLLYDKAYKDYSYAKTLISYSLPLLPNTLSWWAISTANRFIIVYFIGSAANGVFAISYKIPSIFLLLTNVFQLAWQEKAIRNYKKNDDCDDYFSSILKKYIQIIYPIIIFLVAISKFIIFRFTDENFWESWKYVPILMLGVCFQSLASFYGVGYQISKVTSGALRSSIYGGLITIVLSCILIPNFGLYGASIGVALGYFSMFVIRTFHTKAFYHIKFPLKKSFIYLLFFIWTTIIPFSGNDLLEYMNVFLALILLIIELRKVLLKRI